MNNKKVTAVERYSSKKGCMYTVKHLTRISLSMQLDIMDPKVPEDIYKTHLEHARFSTANTVDSARANLASSFVNGFVNCGFGEDKLLTADGNKWIYKHKSYGMMSATASLGLILLWDVDGGLTQIDKLLYTNDDFIKVCYYHLLTLYSPLSY